MAHTSAVSVSPIVASTEDEGWDCLPELHTRAILCFCHGPSRPSGIAAFVSCPVSRLLSGRTFGGCEDSQPIATNGLLGWHVARRRTSLSGVPHMPKGEATSSAESTAHQCSHWPSVGNGCCGYPTTSSVLSK